MSDIHGTPELEPFCHDCDEREQAVSDVKRLHCIACTVGVEADQDEEFNYTPTGEGPFCGACWFFVLHVEALRDRVTDLENQAQADRGERQRQENIRMASPQGRRG